ncbi:hypothetical protein AB835_10585 [Candidatus Endobugula sertula]|uniref:Competence protein ComEA n=1 Tax=Candidatus Endobugula sertula TaxID=62101 RepID=A0A1D2QND9_9GAMM|nr:hypothetical protein AB835_10585 [Candidatus Endobugula sertula]
MKPLFFSKSFLSSFLLLITFSASSSLLADEIGAESLQQPILEQVVKQPIDINQASAEQISSVLKGVGLKKAQAIVEWRESNGEFTSIEQLLEVQGIGEKTLEVNRLKVTI